MGSLSQVLAEVNADGSELAYYTRSDELISMETEGETYTYLSDGHSEVRARYMDPTGYFSFTELMVTQEPFRTTCVSAHNIL